MKNQATPHSVFSLHHAVHLMPTVRTTPSHISVNHPPARIQTTREMLLSVLEEVLNLIQDDNFIFTNLDNAGEGAQPPPSSNGPQQ